MFRLARPPKLPPRVASPPPQPSKPAPAATDQTAYGQEFWFTYCGNTLLMMSVSLLFRYADFVTLLGGSELTLGMIVGVGMIGSFTARLAQGAAIDRYGPRWIWLGSLALVAVTLLAHLSLTRIDTPTVYLIRILYASGIAGSFGASITYISLRAPVTRMAEMIGMLGSSGFLGMALGSILGDFLFSGGAIERWHLDRMFLAAAILVVLSLVAAWFATRKAVRPIARRRPPLLWLIRRYHPGPMLLMGVAMGLGLNLPGTFLRPYSESLGLRDIGAFFGAYALTAFAARVTTRRVPDQIGVRPTIFLGMAALVLSMVLYLFVHSPWTLPIPGVAVGIAHAMLFPAVMAGGSITFPQRYRGLGTTLILSMFDLGNFVGMPLAGTIVELAGGFGLPPYPTMFLTIATLLTAATLLYAVTGRKVRRAG